MPAKVKKNIWFTLVNCRWMLNIEDYFPNICLRIVMFNYLENPYLRDVLAKWSLYVSHEQRYLSLKLEDELWKEASSNFPPSRINISSYCLYQDSIIIMFFGSGMNSSTFIASDSLLEFTFCAIIFEILFCCFKVFMNLSKSCIFHRETVLNGFNNRNWWHINYIQT